MAMIRTLSTFMAAGSLCLIGPEASAQLLPPSSPSQLVTALQAQGLKPGNGFRPNGPSRCRRGSANTEYLFICTTTMIDGGRGGRPATVDIMIFRSYDFARLKAMLKQNLAATSTEVKASMSNKLDTETGGRSYSFPFSCVQERGQHNGSATCVTAASPNVAIMTDVTPLRAGDRSLVGNMMDEDMDHASMLAGNGLEAVVSAANSARPVAPPPARKPKCTIWQVC